MDGIVGSLRLGWNALLFKEDAYEEMRAAANPVVKGLILIIVVGIIVALFGLVGTALEIASTPDPGEIRVIVQRYLAQMPFWDEIERGDPGALRRFQQIFDTVWQFMETVTPSIGGAALGIVGVPLALVVRWLIYGVLAYIFARWLGGTGNLSETLGVLALAVAPQVLNVLTLLPFVQMGNVVSVWGVLCAYFGLKAAHKLSWGRTVWATLLPFILAFALLFLLACLGVAIFGALVRGGLS
jgi:hypothetical protein